MLQDTGDLDLFVDVLREILARFDGVGIARGHQRETVVSFYYATGDALYRSATCGLSLRRGWRLLLLLRILAENPL